MDFDELQPTGYFSEFSWHSFEDDDLPNTPFDWGDSAPVLVAAGAAQESSEAEARGGRQDSQED